MDVFCSAPAEDCQRVLLPVPVDTLTSVSRGDVLTHRPEDTEAEVMGES